MSKRFLIFIIFLVFLSFPITGTSNAFANQILLQENFDDGNVNDGIPADWEEIPGNGIWSVSQGKYIGISSSGLNGPLSIVGNNSWSNYVTEVEITGQLGVDRHILVRYDPSKQLAGYGIKYREQNLGFSGHIELQKLGAVVLASNEDFNAHTGETHLLRVEVLNNNIKVFTDGILRIDFTDDNNPSLTGKVALFVERSGVGITNQTAYDNLNVTSLPDILLNVPNFKQGDLPWGSLVYNNYPNSATTETIRKWGCYLTSASMLLQANNFNINPLQLNEVLKNTGGYDSSHGVDLAAVAAYTKSLNPTDHLEYKWQNFSTQALDAELEAGRPAIVKLQGNSLPFSTHFVVVVGKENGEYLLNDPEPSSTKTKLSDYPSNLYNHIRTLVPANTDFSYMNIYSSLNVIPKVYNSLGGEITGYSYIEGPISADDGFSELSGEPLNVFSFPKPQHDQYSVLFTGSGAYNTQVKLYDKEGNIESQNFTGLLTTGQTDDLDLEIGDSNTLPAVQITLDSTLADLDAANQTGLITNKKIYQLLKAELLLAKYFESKHATFLYTNTLKLALYHMDKYTPQYIKSEASEILQSEVKYLLNN